MKILFFLISLQSIYSDSSVRQISIPLSLESKWSLGASYLKSEGGDIEKGSHLSFSKTFQPFRLFTLGTLGRSDRSISDSQISGEKPPIKISKSLLGGFSFQYVSLVFDFSYFPINNPPFILGLQIHPEKKVYFFQNYDTGELHRGLGILTGDSIRVGFEVEKIVSEQGISSAGTISLIFNFEGFSGGGIFHSTDGQIVLGSSLGISKKEINESYLLSSENVYEREEEPKKPKEPIHPKHFVIDKPFRKEKITFQLSLEELLSRKIDLRNALLIEKASKKREDLEALLKVLPPEIAKKVKFLEIEKNISFEGKK